MDVCALALQDWSTYLRVLHVLHVLILCAHFCVADSTLPVHIDHPHTYRGQKQRIAIARAVIKDPVLLILVSILVYACAEGGVWDMGGWGVTGEREWGGMVRRGDRCLSSV